MWLFSMAHLTFAQNYDRFFVKKAVMKTCGPGKIPREDAIWCKVSVTLPRTIPLLS